jgi:hypothetical protein
MYVTAIPNQKLDSPESIKELCYKKGFYPIEFTNITQISTVLQFISDLKIDLSEGMVPIGYDYSCDELTNTFTCKH